MKHPQSAAVKITELKHINSIAKYGCCAFTVLWCLGIEPDNEFEAIKILDDAIEAGVLEEDCTVIWNKFIPWLTGRKTEVEFVNISSIKSIHKRTPVRFDYNGFSHWGGVENGVVKFNSLDKSNCIAKGKPVTARIIKINGVQI